MTEHKSIRQGRARDRRAGLHNLLATVARVITSRGNATPLRGAFEESLRRATGIRTVHLRDLNSRWRSAPQHHSESMAFDVAASSPLTRGVLEATLDPGAVQSEWEFQLLNSAAHLAAIVLEIERMRAPGSRAEPLVPVAVPMQETMALVGRAPAMDELRSRIARVAQTEFTVLLEGESGVGKELVARQIHLASPRRQGPFVAINCAALVETLLEAELFGIEERTATGVRGRRGKFEHAEGGTLFLDEVGDLSPTAQAKLLRAIQELAVERVGGQGSQRVNIRIVAATNRSLGEMVQQKRFRADLFYRLSGVELRVPALRERRDDIRDLAIHFLDRHRGVRPLTLSESALQALCEYDWPGNVRELERLVERVVALAASDIVEVRDLPPTVAGEFAVTLLPSLRRGDTLRMWACRYARLVYEQSGGNKRQAARRLGISNHTLSTYLKATASRPDAVYAAPRRPETRRGQTAADA